MFSKLNNAKQILLTTNTISESELTDKNFPPLEQIKSSSPTEPITADLCQSTISQSSTNFAADELMPETTHLIASATPLNSSLGVLNWPQVKKLDSLLNKYVPIHGRGTFPTLNVRLKDFIRNLNRRLVQQRVKVKDVRINGGVASYVLATETNYEFSDIDIIYTCDLLQLNNTPENAATYNSSHSLEMSFSNVCDIIKQTVFECLLDHFPNSYTCKDKITIQNIKDAYVKKMVKIYQSNNNSTNTLETPDPDESLDSQQSQSRWSLISLCNDQGQNIELKFVDKMKRQFQFSVDAFQIHLNSLLGYYDCQETIDTKVMTENVYPTVVAESMYGEFVEANYHLNSKLIATKSPEEIRGGGLLKYCNLLIKGYKPICVETQMHSMEKYMCSRFFIDFSDLNDQEHKLNAYLDCHFQNSPRMCLIYLEKLFEVVDSSTVCLMGHERKQTLNLIKAMSNRFQQQYDNGSEENDESSRNLQQVDEFNEEEVVDLHGNVLNKATDFIVDTNSNHVRSGAGSIMIQRGSLESGQSHGRNSSQHYRGVQQHNYQHHVYMKQSQNQNHAQYLNQHFQHHNNHNNHHYNNNSNNKPSRYHNNNHSHNTYNKQQWYIPNQQQKGVKIFKDSDPSNASLSFSGSASSSLSSSPLPTNLIYVNKIESEASNKSKITIPSAGGSKADSSLLFSSSAGSLDSSSISSSVVSSPSPSPSPPLTPFYRYVRSEVSTETTASSDSTLIKVD